MQRAEVIAEADQVHAARDAQLLRERAQLLLVVSPARDHAVHVLRQHRGDAEQAVEALLFDEAAR